MVLARATSNPSWRDPESADPDATPNFDEVYQEHFAFMWHCLRRLGVGDASLRDAAQDAFLVVHRRLPEYEGRAPIRSWLYGIAVRVASNHRRTRQRRDDRIQDIDVEHVADSIESGQQQSLEQQQSLDMVQRLLEQLDPNKREVFVLAELHELSVAEIAAVLGVNAGTIYARLRAARQQFDRAVARHLAQDRRSP